MKIAIVCHLKHPVSRPFAGGLEAFTFNFVEELIRRGHDVSLFASGDSDPQLPVVPIVKQATVPDALARFGYHHHDWIEQVEDAAYAELMQKLAVENFDIVHNHSLSPIPLRYRSIVASPMVTTLHAPPLPRMVAELQEKGEFDCGQFINISCANARKWEPFTGPQTVIHNGVDTTFWKSCQAERRHRAVWFGRILPDKGTHLAIQAAHRAGLSIDVVGPVCDETYFEQQVSPLLKGEDKFLGHQTHDQLCQIISSAAVALVTPCWDEPFGLVVTEALACGTPVAGFARGALPEIIGRGIGYLAPAGDINALAMAARKCLSLDGAFCRLIAERRFSQQTMIDRYEQFYSKTALEVVA